MKYSGTSARLTGKLLTTEFVLLEVGDALSSVNEKSKFLQLLDLVAKEPSFQLIKADTALLQKGIELYRRRPDKDWPLTDCISFVVMNEHGVTDALTGDLHFRQAGFRALFLPA